MSQPPRGQNVFDSALQAIASATTIEQLHQAQTVVLPLQYGMSLMQTAQAIGLSKGWACRLRNQFIAGSAVGDKKASQCAEGDTESTSPLSAKPNYSIVPGVCQYERYFGGQSDQASTRNGAGAEDGIVIGVQIAALAQLVQTRI